MVTYLFECIANSAQLTHGRSTSSGNNNNNHDDNDNDNNDDDDDATATTAIAATAAATTTANNNNDIKCTSNMCKTTGSRVNMHQNAHQVHLQQVQNERKPSKYASKCSSSATPTNAKRKEPV